MKKKKRLGFTLIEILVAIIILVLMLLIAIPTIISSMDRSREKQYDATVTSILSAAEEYVEIYKNINPLFKNLINVNDNTCIELSDLQEEGLIDKKLINPKTNEKFASDFGIIVKVIKENSNKQLSYTTIDNCP